MSQHLTCFAFKTWFDYVMQFKISSFVRESFILFPIRRVFIRNTFTNAISLFGFICLSVCLLTLVLNLSGISTPQKSRFPFCCATRKIPKSRYIWNKCDSVCKWKVQQMSCNAKRNINGICKLFSRLHSQRTAYTVICANEHFVILLANLYIEQKIQETKCIWVQYSK